LKLDKASLRLYAVTDRTWLGENSLASQVEEAIKAGVTFVQLREKKLDFNSFADLAKQIKTVTDKYKIPFVINDNIDVALACNADGVHIGQTDMNAADVRKKIGENKIIGVSVQNAKQAVFAEQNGADYLGAGAVFSTSTKKDAEDVSFEALKSICKSVSIPVVAIGGINKNNVYKLSNSRINGIAVISAIFAQQDIYASAYELHVISDNIFCK
jgi:thiamine-phosphate pyrophosphorylase